MTQLDAVILVSFGGPEGPDDVLPFLQNVTRGRNVPEARLRAVAEQYERFGGVSPINEQNRRLQSALRDELVSAGHDLPVYWGNRNWDPFLTDTVQQMTNDGVRNALAIATSAYSSYSGCQQYLEDLDRACEAVGPSAPAITKAPPYFDRDGFVASFRDSAAAAAAELPGAPIIFTAHSIPLSMAAGCDYEIQLRATAALVADAVPGRQWSLAWQSRSGPPSVPWLAPDINDRLRELAANGVSGAVIVPLGFVSDHMEVLYDLDVQAAETAAEVGIDICRARTPGTEPDPRFVRMWATIVDDVVAGRSAHRLSALPERPFPCARDCCPAAR